MTVRAKEGTALPAEGTAAPQTSRIGFAAFTLETYSRKVILLTRSAGKRVGRPTELGRLGPSDFPKKSEELAPQKVRPDQSVRNLGYLIEVTVFPSRLDDIPAQIPAPAQSWPSPGLPSLWEVISFPRETICNA